jgi:hypothetical protein
MPLISHNLLNREMFSGLNSCLLNLQIGADVHGTIDGAFDSGYLMTAVVNGQLFRGVLFAPVSKSFPGNELLHTWFACFFPEVFHLRDLE